MPGQPPSREPLPEQPKPKPKPPDHRYTIGESVQYSTRGFAPPSPERAPTVPLEEAIAKPPGVGPEKEQMRAQNAPLSGFSPEEATRPRPAEKRAVWIVHGMGQQLPFETLDALAKGLIDVIDTPVMPGQPPPFELLQPPVVANVKFASPFPGSPDQVTQRVELDIQRTGDPAHACQLHLYEAYWAPVTEGAAKLSDVISFLFTAGMRGLINFCKPFRRAMFPDQMPPAAEPGIYDFTIPFRSFAEIVLTFLVLLSLIAINAVIVTAGAAKAGVPVFTLTAFSEHWMQLAAFGASASAVALTFGVILFLGEMCRRRNLPKPLRLLISILGWIGFSLTTFTVIAAAFFMSTITRVKWVAYFSHDLQLIALQGCATAFLLAAFFLVVLAFAVRGMNRSSGSELHGDPLLVFLFVLSFLLHLAVIPSLFFAARYGLSIPPSVPGFLRPLLHHLTNSLWVFPALGVLAKQVRDLLIQYPGDVAIYVDSNKVDRFDKIRKEIKQIALNSAAGIYTARNAAGTDFEYSRIAVVGHSLGSVIAYDTLNKLLALDDLVGNPVGVEDRTCLLETFGSPLDKLAYFFTIQGKETFHIREQLAAVVQPLIQSYARFRNLPWINVFSRNDIVCGQLRFYDVPGHTGPSAILNLVDKDAAVPLVAHVTYWRNSLVWQALMSKIAP